MKLNASRFPEFFEATTGFEPFPWQQRLFTYIQETGRWPDQISAPTGCGKSNVVHIHAFVNALAAVGAGPRVPRRLVLVVNRRGLVDSQEVLALSLRSALINAQSGILFEVAQALGGLATGPDAEPLAVTNMRGGMPSDPTWLMDPSGCRIICGTPDMVGSRLLMRGYGSTRYAWPREAGLLSHDTALVLDEAHLNRQFLTTVKRVSSFAQGSGDKIGVPALQVTAASATLDDSVATATTVSVDEDDMADPVIAARLLRPKPTTFLEVAEANTAGRYSAAVLDAVMDQVVELRSDFQGQGTVGCIVNTVRTAVELAERLRRQKLNVRCWVGRMRPLDLEEMRTDHPGLFTTEGDPSVDVLVTTQTVEVGVDIDLAAIVTELAPGTALTQRAGRVNRLGQRESARIVVFGPKKPTRDCGPYSLDELTAATSWLMERSQDPNGLAPWAVQRHLPPHAALRRTAQHRLELYDADLLTNTSMPLFADADLSLFLRDDLSQEPATCGVVIRELLEDDSQAISLLRAVPPEPREVFPVRMGVVREIIEGVLSSPRSQQNRVYLWREEELSLLNAEFILQPGDIFVLGPHHKILCEGVVVEPSAATASAKAESGRKGTIVVLPQTSIGDLGPWSTGEELLSELAELTAEEAQDFVRVQPELSGYQVVLPPPQEQGSELPWLVLRPPVSEEEQYQTWTAASESVLLTQHARAVADRGARLASAVSAAANLEKILELAGEHHDDGKEDARWQRSIGATRGDPVWAKSRLRNQQHLARTYVSSGLPRGWRHEQLSVLRADRAIDLELPFRDIVLRLIGTSHGRGRIGFRHSTDILLQEPTEEQRAWFSHGEWEQLIERTEDAWGTWGCAYLEALLRAADGQVSKEGS